MITHTTRHQRRFRLGALGIMLVASCDSREPPQTQPTAPAETVVAAPKPIVHIALGAPEFAAASPIARDVTGLVLVRLEAGLADLGGVVPAVESAEVAPGLRALVSRDHQSWTARVAVAVANEQITARVTVCDAADHCTVIDGTAPVREPAQMLGELIHRTAMVIARDASDRATLRWSAPQSRDPYAVRVLGRAAAVVYGLTAVPESAIGKVRRDPVARAAFLDPSMPLAQWLVARRARADDRAFDAFTALSAALEHDPTSVALLAGRADALGLLSRPEEAAATWRELDRLLPRDARFFVPRASAELRAGKPVAAAAVVAELPASYHDDPGVAALRVDLADHGALDGDIDALLAVWQDADDAAVEPVRRRVLARLTAGDVDAATAMLDEYARRADPRAAAQMRLAVAVAGSDWDRAEDAAAALGDDETMRAVRARAADASAVPAAPGATSDAYQLALYGEAALRRGDAEAALRLADRALAAKTPIPEALLLRWSALTQLGRTDAAQKTLARLRVVDPRSARALETQGPSTAPGSTGSGTQPQPASP